jgi:hypothetical protein
MVRSQPGQIVRETLSWKISNQKRASRVAQMVESLLRKCETLNSKHQYHQKEKLTRGRIDFGSWFQMSQLTVACCLGPVVRLHNGKCVV